MLTKLEQQIYNSHLATSRKVQNKPFKIRQKFDDLEEDKVITLQRLSRFFNEYKNLDIDTFFLAPHKIYPEESYYPLEYFLTRKAISCYTQYVKQLETQDPDNKDSLERLQKSLKFVFNYCKEHQLTFENYRVYLEPDTSLPIFIDHLKNHKINFYTLHALNFSQPKIESRILDFIFNNFYTTFQTTKNKFQFSKKMKEFSKLATNKLVEKLKSVD
jgi:hypothetical protein